MILFLPALIVALIIIPEISISRPETNHAKINQVVSIAVR
jgi:hypothetical protein